jgi:hypothetical protein
MEQQSRNTSLLAGLCLGPAEVLDSLSIGTSENLVIELLTRNASSEKLKNSVELRAQCTSGGNTLLAIHTFTQTHSHRFPSYATLRNPN